MAELKRWEVAMRIIFLLLSALAASTTFAEAPLEWIPVDRSDGRAVVELHVMLKADALPETQHAVLYFIPAASATDAEKATNRGLASGAVGPFRNVPASGYTVTVHCQPKDVLVDLSASSFGPGPSSSIEREASFLTDYFKDIKGERAGISFEMRWRNKPNQASEPTAASGRGSP